MISTKRKGKYIVHVHNYVFFYYYSFIALLKVSVCFS